MKCVQLAVLAACLCAVSAGMLPKKLVKKFAMKKVSEDCYGKDVMAGLKKEMYAAHVKCSGHHPDELPAADVLIADDGVTLSRRRRSAGARHFSPDKLEKMRAKIVNFFGNATCVLKEMKMLDQENNVDLDSIKERLANMDIDEKMKKELDESLDDCFEFSSCPSESLVNKYNEHLMGFGRQMIFFSCFKEAKLKACMKKTFREDYLPMMLEQNVSADEDDSFYTMLTSAKISEDSLF